MEIKNMRGIETMTDEEVTSMNGEPVLARCKLCGSEAELDSMNMVFCPNKDCPLDLFDGTKEQWQKLNAPDTSFEELVKENQALRVLCGEAAEELYNYDMELQYRKQPYPNDLLYSRLKKAHDDGILETNNG